MKTASMTEKDYFYILFLKEAETAEPPLIRFNYQQKDTAANDLEFLADRARAGNRQKEIRKIFSIESLHESFCRWRNIILFSVALLLFCTGVLSNYLSVNGHVNLLFNAVIAYIGWNMLVYVAMGIRLLFSRSSNLRKPASIIGSIFSSCFHWLALQTKKYHLKSSSGETSRLVSGFFRNLFTHLNDYYRWKITSAFHFWALSLASGIIAGLYLRGLAVEFSFYWESTFIESPRFVEGLMQIISSPATLLFPITLPDIAARGMMMPGADWIHIFSLSLIAYVVIPRIILLIFSQYNGSKALSDNVPDLREDYFRNILFNRASNDLVDTIVVYGYSIESQDRRQLLSGIENLMGIEAAQAELLKIKWGKPFPESLKENGKYVIVFNGVQTPEKDVHGIFLADCARKTNKRISVVIDLSKIGKERYPARREAWSSFIDNMRIEFQYRFLEPDSVAESDEGGNDNE
jgi:hypothetical protein